MHNQTLLDYSKSVKELKKRCLQAGMTESEFKALYLETLNELQTNEINSSRPTRMPISCRTIISISFVAILIIGCNIQTIHSSLQELIYPGLRILRKVSIPFLSLFPALTELYHETCLIQNPFFTVVDMECWPCSTISRINEIEQPDTKQQFNGPFFYKTNQKVVKIGDLQDFYNKNKEIFDNESPKVQTNNNFYVSPSEMFNVLNRMEKEVFIWKLNTMNTARTFRQFVPRPKIVPKFGQTTERYIIIDTSQSTFRLPDPECNFSFILVLSGSRIIDLKPADECKHQCKTLTMDLKETQLLWYNWWYWKPAVRMSNNNETFIAHMGSYCI